MGSRPQPWHVRLRKSVSGFWRTQDSRVAAVRDVAVAGGFVLLLLGSIWLYTGQRFPSQAPLVVIESGSMMHGRFGPCMGGQACSSFSDPAFGRVGTIDPGDLVLVKRVKGLDDVETAFDSDRRSGYGGHGDVIVYHPEKRFPSQRSTPVIHRAALRFDLVPAGCTFGDASQTCKLRIPETCSSGFEAFVRSGSQSDWREYCQGSTEPVSLDLERNGLFLRLIRYPCTAGSCPPTFHAGILTKGDNNNDMDQPQITCCPVDVSQIVGKARGEIPWFGLIKLALYGNARYGCGFGQDCQDPTRGNQWTIFRATAPWDIWVSLFLAIGVAVMVPVVIDFAVGRFWKRDRAGAKKPPTS